jgi:hypothetical protein
MVINIDIADSGVSSNSLEPAGPDGSDLNPLFVAKHSFGGDDVPVEAQDNGHDAGSAIHGDAPVERLTKNA